MRRRPIKSRTFGIRAISESTTNDPEVTQTQEVRTYVALAVNKHAVPTYNVKCDRHPLQIP